MYTDPKTLKRQRDREYYARYKDDIQQRWRESNEKKKNSVTLPNDEQNVPHTPLSMCQSNEDAPELKRQRERERYSQNRDKILKRQREAYSQKNVASAPSHNNDQENETHTPVSAVSLGNDDQPLHTPLLFSTNLFFRLYMQILKRQRGSGKGCIIHRIERKY
jgi:hypothetical protein